MRGLKDVPEIHCLFSFLHKVCSFMHGEMKVVPCRRIKDYELEI